LVGEYRGRVIDVALEGETSSAWNSDPAYTLLFALDDDLTIDAGVKGNSIRFMNHSCDPNCETSVELDRVFVHARRPIRPGEELTYDYNLQPGDPAVTAHQLHLRLEVTNKTALGIVRRLAAVIANAGGNPHAGGLHGTSQTSTRGRRQRALRRGPTWAPGADGWEELPWIKFPRQPTRQFLRFADTVRQLGCPEDEMGFERLLAAIGARDAPSSMPGVRRFAGSADRDLEHAAA